MGAYEFGGLMAYIIIFSLLIFIFKWPVKLLIALFSGANEYNTINGPIMATYDYRGFATLAGGNHPQLGSAKRRIVIALKENFFYVLNQDLSPIVRYPIRDVKAENTTVSNATARNIFLFGIMALGLNETLLQIEIYDTATKETYGSLFTETGINPDCINKARYDYLVQENSAQAVQS